MWLDLGCHFVFYISLLKICSPFTAFVLNNFFQGNCCFIVAFSYFLSDGSTNYNKHANLYHLFQVNTDLILIKYSNSALICLHFFPSSLSYYHHILLCMLLIQKYIAIIITLHNLMSFNKIRRKEKKYIYTTFYICCCSVTKSCPTLCDPRDCSTPDFPVLHYFPEFAQTHGDAIQPFQPLLPPSSYALNPSQHQGLFQ